MDREILICYGTGCLSAGAQRIAQVLRTVLMERELSVPLKKIVKETGCFGPCSLGPMLTIMPEGTFYGKVRESDVERIVDEHLIGGRPVTSLLVADHSHEDYRQMDFFQGQVKVALRNTGFIDPLQIEDYLAREGYQALKKVLGEMTPADVIEEIKASGLRGRGGAGFPTGVKWEATRVAPGDEKYVICNADEGDPGAFMDRSILEGDPHSIIEAMAIAGYAVGASQSFVYVRAEYPLAIANLSQALETARKAGYIGEKIFGSDFSFDIDIRVGAGAFVCGEETALMASIEGYRGQPRPKPPFPSEAGLWGRPTVINNVETLANIPPIILKGSRWFTQLGTEESRGTKVFAVAGDVRYTGLVEVPMGTTLRQLIFQIGGGIPRGKEFKAVQIGGPSGATLPGEYLDLSIDYDSLKSVGAIIGSGGLIVMDEDNCMVDVARYFLDFTQDESCGKCIPCRIGTRRMLEILEGITEGEGTREDLERLAAVASMVGTTSLCGLGQTAPNPVLSTLRYFREEYEIHIEERYCPAGSCQALRGNYRIQEELCTGCGLCRCHCPVGAIAGERRQIHHIEGTKCTSCGACAKVCPVGAVLREGG
ncbi:MAG: NADH-ubiquinone oxidoreductase-F iron-sulfur binding region domain-containing protein [Limnochordia bacterium]